LAEKITERTLYAPIISYIGGLGFKGIQEVQVKGKYPDVTFWYDSHKFIVQVKIGEQKKLLEGLVDAYEHSRNANVDNIIVLVYPTEIRRPIAYAGQVERLTLQSEIDTLILTTYWRDTTKITVQQLFTQLKEKIIKEEITPPRLEFVITTLRESIELISGLLCSYSTTQLSNAIDQVVGRFDLFLALGQLGETEREELQLASIDLISYLLVNQILFYHIYASLSKKVPELPETIEDVAKLQEHFKIITDINYKAIYSVDILLQLPHTPRITEIVQKIVKGIKVIRPENVTHDLIGRLFHELLPPKTRKILAAFYTKPIAAEILAGLAIDKWNEQVADIACGSGTLLVAAYRRKLDLFKQSQIITDDLLEQTHRQFVERELTGIDIMPFAAHLTAVNLSSQTISVTTNDLRISINDSIEFAKQLKVSDHVEVTPFTRTIQKELQVYEEAQKRLTEYTKPPKYVEVKGAISPEVSKALGFTINKLDCVIMNPPFTDREKMPEDFRNKLLGKSKDKTLNDAIKRIVQKCGNQINLWGYFLALADDLLKPNGKLGVVIPINIFRGKGTEDIRDLVLDNYQIRYVVKATRNWGFSESADFRDVLLIAEKIKPTNSDLTGIVLLKKAIQDLTFDDARKIQAILRKIPKGIVYHDDYLEVYWVSYQEIKKHRDNLMLLVGFTEVKTKETIEKFMEVLAQRARAKLTTIKREWIREGFGARPAGLSELIYITNPSGIGRTTRATMVLERQTARYKEVKVKDSGFRFKISKSKIIPAVRTNTGINTLDIAGKHDYLVLDDFEGFEQLMSFSKYKEKKKFSWNVVRENIRGKETYLALPERFDPYSVNTCLLGFYCDDEFVPNNTMFLLTIKDRDFAKLLCLSINSIVYLVDFYLFKQETTRRYTHIKASDFVLFHVPDLEQLTKKEKRELLDLFNRLKHVEFPSILYQLKNRFLGRMELDRTILKLLGLKNEEIDRWLPQLYDVLVTELETTIATQ